MSLNRGTSFALRCLIRLQWGSGARHENLPADGADRYTFDRDSLHFGAETAVENAAAITAGCPASDHHSFVSGKLPFPARISCTHLLGSADSSLSISAGWICAGALPPLTALPSTRIAGARASPWTGRIRKLPKPRSSAASTSPRPSARQIRLSTPPDFRMRRLAGTH